MTTDRTLLLQQIFSTVRTGILAIDANHEVLLVNDAARTILDLGAAPCEGQPLRSMLGEHPQLVAFLSDTLLLRTPLDRTEIQITGHRPMTIGITTTPLSRTSEDRSGVVALIKNLTQIEQMEEQAQLKERLVALGQMAAGLAHEMRNPLASIKIMVGLLRKTSAQDPDLERKLCSILSDVQRLNQSVTDCLAFARPIRFEPRHVRIEEILDKVLGQVVSLEHTYPFQIIRQFTPDPPLTWVDPQQLEIVFFNIINNAIDAVRQCHGTIVISTGLESGVSSSGKVVVTVSDDGEGIPADQLPRLFLPFFTTKGKGSGLGLANAKKIMEHLHGTIEVKSQIGTGTTFTVRIPLAAAEAAPAA
ncbi:MAG: GHKL domain-containing protein [Nitrospirae bacterium]|nr:GHKL domain-containing protein [Nitrospirota bacterium]